MIRLLLVGCGQIARAAHLPALKRLEGEGLVELSVFDVDEDRSRAVGEQFGVRTVADWQSAAGQLDALAVCVPPGPNAEIAAAAASMGLHVLCEKPPGRNLEQARRMATASATHPERVTMLGFNRRFAPLVRKAAERSSRLGPPTSLYGRFCRSALGGVPSNTAADWITSDSSHALDLAVAMMGFPHAVSVARRVVGVGPDNVWTLQLHTELGSALLQLNYAAGSRVETVEWIGPGYDVRIELPDAARWTRSGANPENWTSGEPPPPRYEALGFLDEYRAFLAAIAGIGPRPECDFRYGAEFMRLVATVLESPSGTLQPLARTTFEPHVEERPAARSSPRPARPVVVLHHSLAAQSRYFEPDVLLALRECCEVRTWDDDHPAAVLEDSNVLITGRGAPRLSPQMLDRAQKLELLVVLGASVRHLDPEALVERGVTICNTADAVAQGVAEHCLMVTLAGLRQLTRHDSAMHRGEWDLEATRRDARGPRGTRARSRIRAMTRRVPVPLSIKKRLYRWIGSLRRGVRGPRAVRHHEAGQWGESDLHGQVVGLLGWGNVARHFARLLSAFDCPVLVWTESATPEELAAAGARAAGLSEILGSAKVISLHRGLTDQTRGFLDARRLSEIGAGSVIVNTARGALIDEQALIARLLKGGVVAALDVFDEEPLPRKHPLRALPNVILTPHNAGNTMQEERRLGSQALGYVIDWAQGGTVPAIDASRLARMS